MIGIGSDAMGREIARLPVSRAIQALHDVLRAPAQPVCIDVVFVVPGRLGGPDFDGYVVRRARGTEPTQVFVAVPSETAVREDPMTDLIGLARQAVLAAVRVERRARCLDEAALLGELDRARARLTSGEPARPTQGEQPVHIMKRQRTLVVELPISGTVSLDDAFAVEAALTELLDAGGVAHVDGNQVGDGVFEIFVVDADAAVVRQVRDVIRSVWRHGRVRLRSWAT